MDEELEIKIEQALVIINNDRDQLLFHDYFNQYSFVYVFTTENLKGYYDQLNFKDKSVLTVCGSGDQILNAILLGAENVDTFDINELSFMFYKLKVGAIKALSYDNYFKYFCMQLFQEDENILDIKSYWKISEYLDEETRIFWDNLYLEANGNEIRRSNLFHGCYEDKEYLTKVNNYLSEENYYQLRNMINKVQVNFISCDINELSSKLKNSYDYMFLSNIAQYIPTTYVSGWIQTEEEINKDINELRNFKNIIESLSNNLKESGVICVSYFWDILGINQENPTKIIDNPGLRELIFSKDKYTYLIFPSTKKLQYESFSQEVIDRYLKGNKRENEKDGVLIYRK